MNKFIYLVLSISIILSCSSDDDSSSQVIGCTDPDAVNYNPNADESGAICYYSVLGDWTAYNWTVDGTDVFTNSTISYADMTIFDDSSFILYIGYEDGSELSAIGVADYDQSNNTATMTYNDGTIEYWEVTYIDGDELSVRIPSDGTVSNIDWIRF